MVMWAIELDGFIKRLISLSVAQCIYSDASVSDSIFPGVNVLNSQTCCAVKMPVTRLRQRSIRFLLIDGRDHRKLLRSIARHLVASTVDSIRPVVMPGLSHRLRARFFASTIDSDRNVVVESMQHRFQWLVVTGAAT